MDLTLDEYNRLRGMAEEDGQRRVDISALYAKCGPPQVRLVPDTSVQAEPKVVSARLAHSTTIDRLLAGRLGCSPRSRALLLSVEYLPHL